jgi:hypothetical protein
MTVSLSLGFYPPPTAAKVRRWVEHNAEWGKDEIRAACGSLDGLLQHWSSVPLAQRVSDLRAVITQLEEAGVYLERCSSAFASIQDEQESEK